MMHPTFRIALAATAWLACGHAVQAQNSWTFGMNVALTQNAYGNGLLVTSVVPYSPAQMAGLKPGDTIMSVNGRGFGQVFNSIQGLQVLQSATTAGGYGAGLPTPPGVALMQVLDSYAWRVVPRTCQPRNNFGPGGGIGIGTGVAVNPIPVNPIPVNPIPANPIAASPIPASPSPWNQGGTGIVPANKIPAMRGLPGYVPGATAQASGTANQFNRQAGGG